MKKLLALLAFAPLTIAACGSAANTTEPIETIVPIEDKDKAELVKIYKVQDYENYGLVTGTLQYYIEAVDGAELSGWDFSVHLLLKDAAVGRTISDIGLVEDHAVTTERAYALGHDLEATRRVQFELSLDLEGVTGIDGNLIDDFHYDEDRMKEEAEAYKDITSESSYETISSIRNRFSYVAQVEDAIEVTSFFKYINFVASKGEGDDAVELTTSMIIEKEVEEETE